MQKTKQNITPSHIMFKFQKIKDKEKILEDARGKNSLPIEKQR